MFGFLTVWSNACTSSRENTLEQRSQKHVSDKEWKNLINKAAAEADTLCMNYEDIINILAKHNIIHFEFYPIRANDSLYYINGISDGNKNLLLINDYQDGLIRTNNHIRLTVVHELMHRFYESKRIYLSEPEIDARAWIWYKKNILNLKNLHYLGD